MLSPLCNFKATCIWGSFAGFQVAALQIRRPLLNYFNKSLALISSIRIMRALPLLAALVHRFLTYLSRF
jgi:hypothetical protein